MDEKGVAKGTIYNTEVPKALAQCGFTRSSQGSVYYTQETPDRKDAIIEKLKQVLRSQAPQFCQFVNEVAVYRMEEWSDITSDLKSATHI